MAEKRLGLLCSASSILAQTRNKNYDILRSYYLMRCPELRSSKTLPNININKQRCSYCCLEWYRDAKCQVKTVKLSRRQKKRMKYKNKCTILKSMQVEKICSLCRHATIVQEIQLDKKFNTKIKKAQKNTIEMKPPVVGKQEPKLKSINVYANIKDAFSIRKESNIENHGTAVVKIKNNKKKKDKYAGLCQKAVLDAVKRKNADEKKNKLNLFLKPSI